MRFSSTANQVRLSKLSDQYNTFLLANPSFSEILSHPGTPQEILNSNQLLMNSITSANLQTLIRLVTLLPEDSASIDETFKFPFVASQFFCSQFSRLAQQVLEDRDLFCSLLSFLNEKSPFPILCGYFSKVCDNLIETNTEKFLFEFFKFDGHLMLASKMCSSSLSDLFGKILLKTSKFDEFFEELQNSLAELARNLKNFDELECFNSVSVFKRLNDCKNSEFSGFWVKIFSRSQGESEQSTVIYKSILRRNKEILAEILQGVKSEKKYLRTACLKILLDVFQSVNCKRAEEVNWALGIFLEHSEDLLSSLNTSKISQDFLSVLEIIKVVLASESEEVVKKVIELGFFRVLIEGVAKNPFCNFFHNLFLSIISGILSSNLAFLKVHLMEDLKFLDFIISQTENPLIIKGRSKTRKGFIPHLFYLANILQGLKKNDKVLFQATRENKSWKRFSRSTLKKQNFIESKQLGGENLENFFEKSSSSDDRPLDFDDILVKNQFLDLEYWKLPVNTLGQLEDL